jgi:ATP-dependent DNA helicase DinG
LIRGENDRGCVICLDPRIAVKGYGKIFLNALPNCPRIFEKGPLMQEKLKEFFKQFQ